jgi:hypothetical protein
VGIRKRGRNWEDIDSHGTWVVGGADDESAAVEGLTLVVTCGLYYKHSVSTGE